MVYAHVRWLAPLLAWAIWTWGGVPAQAGDYLPPPIGTTARVTASASIIAREAPPQLLPAVAARSATHAIDGAGRSLSVSLPSRLTLHGATGEMVARAALVPASAGVAGLRLTPDQPLGRTRATEPYVGQLPLTLDYN